MNLKNYAETIRDGEIDDEVDDEIPTVIEMFEIFVPSARTVAVLLVGCLLGVVGSRAISETSRTSVATQTHHHHRNHHRARFQYVEIYAEGRCTNTGMPTASYVCFRG